MIPEIKTQDHWTSTQRDRERENSSNPPSTRNVIIKAINVFSHRYDMSARSGALMGDKVGLVSFREIE